MTVVRSAVRPSLGPPVYGSDNLPVYRGGSSGGQEAPFSPADLFLGGEIGDYWDTSDIASLFQDSAGTTPVVSPGDPIGLMRGQRGIIDMLQTTSGNRPAYTADGGANLNRSGSAKSFVTAVNLEIEGNQNLAIGLRIKSTSGPLQFYLASSGGGMFVFDLHPNQSGGYIAEESVTAISDLPNGVATNVLVNSINGDNASFADVDGSVTNYTPNGSNGIFGRLFQVYPDAFGADITWWRGLVISRDLTLAEQANVAAWLAEIPV